MQEGINFSTSLRIIHDKKKFYIVVKWFPQSKKISAEKYLAKLGGSRIKCIFNSIDLLCFLLFFFPPSSKHPKSNSDIGQEETIVELDRRGLLQPEW